MTKFIQLTEVSSGMPIWIALSHIQAIEKLEMNGNATVWLDSQGEAVEVMETPEDIINLIFPETFSPGAV